MLGHDIYTGAERHCILADASCSLSYRMFGIPKCGGWNIRSSCLSDLLNLTRSKNAAMGAALEMSKSKARERPAPPPMRFAGDAAPNLARRLGAPLCDEVAELAP